MIMLIGHGPTGITHDFFAFNSAGNVWNGSGFVPWVDADYQTYRIAATETGTSGRFTASPPAATSFYELRIRGATLADSAVVSASLLNILNLASATDMLKGRGPTGELHDFFVFNPANEVWYPGGSAFVPWMDANYQNYRIAATEVGTSGLFTATSPVGAETYELRLRASTLANSATVDEGEISLVTGGITAPPDASMTTGYTKVYDNAGVIAPGVEITGTMADVHTQIEEGVSPTLISGIALSSAPRIVISDASGEVEFTNLFKGVVYSFKRGNGRAQQITIPLDAGSVYQLPVLIGAP